MPKTICKIPGCGKAVLARGWCNKHYLRWRSHGSPTGGRAEIGVGLEWLATNTTLDACTPDACLLWPFGTTSGYGTLWHNGRQLRVHRIVCEQEHGPEPADRPYVAHNCGVRGCVNPHHLRWATQKENLADMILHGTRREGEALHSAKLTEDQVRVIRADHANMTQQEVADRYGVHQSNVSRIINGKNWKHLP